MSYPAHLLPSAPHIKSCLPPELSMNVTVFDTLDSTNTEAHRRLTQGLQAPFLTVAHRQTDGRGRLGRAFHSPRGSGLYMTLVFDSQASLDRLSSVTPAAAVATAEAISEVCCKEVGIKWVNDLYLDGKKVCGILTEAVVFESGYHVIVGIGVNLTTRDFPEGMRNPAGAVLSETDPPVDQSLLCARITQKLFKYLRPACADDCLTAYRSRLILLGERVIGTRHFPSDGEALSTDGTEGTVVGVDEDYGLILRLEDGTFETLRGGEISIKRKM